MIMIIIIIEQTKILHDTESIYKCKNCTAMKRSKIFFPIQFLAYQPDVTEKIIHLLPPFRIFDINDF